MNHELEITFGQRGPPDAKSGWAIFARGRYMTELMHKVREEYLTLKQEGENMVLIDIWISSLYAELKRM
jgi:hypothetical protein